MRLLLLRAMVKDSLRLRLVALLQRTVLITRFIESHAEMRTA